MEKLQTELKKIVEELGYYLYDVTYKKEHGNFVLRIMIENDTYIDIDDCIKVSKAVSALLDEKDPIEEAYNLEVTSPGAERELRTDAEIKRAVGKDVYVETIEQKIYGKLISYNNNVIELKQKNKSITKINDFDVSFIRLAIIF